MSVPTDQLVEAARDYVAQFRSWVDADEPDDIGPAPVLGAELLDVIATRLEQTSARVDHLLAIADAA